ncbi:hypothetical protein Tco_1241706 [Tanacetum coccineum]
MKILLMKMEILEWVIQQVSQRLWVVKSSREERNVGKSNIGDSDNIGDGGKIVSGAIGSYVAWRTFLDGKKVAIV